MVKVDDWLKWKLIENALGITLFGFYISIRVCDSENPIG